MLKLISLFLFLSISVKAGVQFSLLSNFSQDNKSISSSNSTSTLYDISTHVFLSKSEKWALTVGYSGSESQEPLDDSTEATLKTENPYTGLTYFFGKKSLYSIGAYYSPFVRARYSESTSAEEETWSGSSFMGRITVQPLIFKSLRVLLSLTYVSSQYDEKGSSATVSDVDSFDKSVLTPMVGLSYQF